LVICETLRCIKVAKILLHVEDVKDIIIHGRFCEVHVRMKSMKAFSHLELKYNASIIDESSEKSPLALSGAIDRTAQTIPGSNSKNIRELLTNKFNREFFPGYKERSLALVWISAICECSHHLTFYTRNDHLAKAAIAYSQLKAIGQ
jgi:hypothetical protein